MGRAAFNQLKYVPYWKKANTRWETLLEKSSARFTRGARFDGGTCDGSCPCQKRQ
jgi:hypothetical protein